MTPTSWKWPLAVSCLVTALSACGGVADPSTPPGGSGALSGTVYSSGPVAGAHIQVLSEGGEVLADADDATDPFGRFDLADLDLPATFRIEASGGTVFGVPSSATLKADGASADLAAGIQVNPLSTLWSECRDKGVGPSADELDARLAAFLELPPHWRFRDLVPCHDSFQDVIDALTSEVTEYRRERRHLPRPSAISTSRSTCA